MKFEMVHDIVESNGKTIKENNILLKHNIPIGTLVEISESMRDMEGVRLFVVMHTRDCDGTPLYSLCAEKNEKIYNIYGCEINRKYHGFSEKSLELIKEEN